MKQELRRQQTLQLLLNTVKELIVIKGCDSLKMSDIMEHSGLSKGAIFHYVKSKDEIFAMVLQERLEEINNRFTTKVVEHERPAFEGPFQEIAKSLRQLEDPADITNKVVMYLLGKSDQPVVAETLNRFYIQSVELSKHWIVTGQRHGVIPESVPVEQTAELFVLISFGLRMRSALPSGTFAFTSDQFSTFLSNTLRAYPEKGKEV